MLQHTYSFHAKQNSSDLIQTITIDTDLLTSGILIQLLNFISNAFLAPALILTLLLINSQIALGSASLLGGVYFLIFRSRQRILRHNSKLVSKSGQKKVKIVQEGVGGIRDIILNRNQPFFDQVYYETEITLKTSQAKNLFISQSPSFLIETIVLSSIAVLSLGMRLVPGCDPEVMKDRVEKHIEGLGYYIVREEPTQEERLQYPKIAKIERGGGYPAAKTSMSDPFAQEIIKRTRDVVGEELILMPSLGGSLPLYLFTDVLEKPAIIVPIANHDNNQHAPNENIRVENLWYGVRLMGGLLTM
jgi:acetylornithine deacetylase/succinyl-diaminopimelate desuccinylase-like protein